MKKANVDVKAAMKAHKVPAWAIGTVLNVHENTVIRRLRTELSEQEKQELFRIINELSENSDPAPDDAICLQKGECYGD